MDLTFTFIKDTLDVSSSKGIPRPQKAINWQGLDVNPKAPFTNMSWFKSQHR